jgi:hypothetical protein
MACEEVDVGGVVVAARLKKAALYFGGVLFLFMT